jgi:general secretion pathway protein G
MTMTPIPAGRGKDSGYTLMELLVVLAILGLLTAIATPFALHYLETAKVKAARAEIANLSAGLDMFKADVGRYPTTQEGLDALLKAPAEAENWDGPYVKKDEGMRDPWGHAYNYQSPGQHREFDLFSYGPNKQLAPGEKKPLVANW